MSVFEPSPGEASGQIDHEHDVLLVAGSRPEVARLAPVAAAVSAADRIRGITVATGPDPMAVHEAYESLGVPVDITILLPGDQPDGSAEVAAALLVRLDRLMVEVDPSAVLVHGGGMAAAVAATVAFWRRIPVVHMQAGVGTDDLLCPFPQEAHRRVIGQLASLFLTTSDSALGSPLGPNVLTIGDTVDSLPDPADPGCAAVVARTRAGGGPLVLVDLNRDRSRAVLDGVAELRARCPQAELVLTGDLPATGPPPFPAGDPRITVAPQPSLPDLLVLMSAATVLVSDDHDLVVDGPGLGALAVLVDGASVAQPGDSIRSVAADDVASAVAQVLDRGHGRPGVPGDGSAAARAEQAIAWMFGLSESPRLPGPASTEEEPSDA